MESRRSVRRVPHRNRAARKALALAALLLVWMGTAAPARAAVHRCDGIIMPEHERAFGVDLVLNGMGVRRVTIFKVHVFVAGLYLEQPTRKSAEAMRPDRVKLVTLAFVRDSERKEMMEFLRERIKARLSGAERDKTLKALETFGNKYLVDPRIGSRISVAYRAGDGMEVRHNGKFFGVHHDDKIADFMFNAWLGTDPSDETMTGGLLGGKCVD